MRSITMSTTAFNEGFIDVNEFVVMFDLITITLN